MADAVVFEWIGAVLERETAKPRPEARGTLCSVRKEAGIAGSSVPRVFVARLPFEAPRARLFGEDLLRRWGAR